jgi:hypothetical protein
VNIPLYIESGIVEAYVLGLVTPEEKQEFESALPLYPVLQQALNNFETRVEKLAQQNAVPPPADTRRHFVDFLDGLPVLRKGARELPPHSNDDGNGTKKNTYITAKEVSSDHIKVHKYWRIAFLVVFILSKIFLGFLIYYALRFHETQMELKQLQQQLHQQQQK